MRGFWATWRQESRRHPSVRVLTLAGLLGFLLAAILMAGQMPLLGELVAGLAVAPLVLALYICLLNTGTWQEGGSDDDGGGGGETTPDPPRDPDGGATWERFESEFWAYVDERVAVG
jgi:hypothetical protein